MPDRYVIIYKEEHPPQEIIDAEAEATAQAAAVAAEKARMEAEVRCNRRRCTIASLSRVC